MCHAGLPADFQPKPTFSLRDGAVQYAELRAALEAAMVVIRSEGLTPASSRAPAAAAAPPPAATSATSATSAVSTAPAPEAGIGSSSGAGADYVADDDTIAAVYRAVYDFAFGRPGAPSAGSGSTGAPAASASRPLAPPQPQPAASTPPPIPPQLGPRRTSNAPRAPAAPRAAPARDFPGISQVKTCGHRCGLSSYIPQCCACSDRRPLQPPNTYARYVDGQGYRDCGSREHGYCPVCRK
eukprot:gene40333-49152_t